MPQQKTGLEDLGFEPAADLTDLGFVRATAEEEKPPQTAQELAMALAEQRASRKSVPGYLEAQRAKQAIEQKRQQTYLATRGLPEAALAAVTGGAALPVQMAAGGVIGGAEGGTPGAVAGAAFPLLGAAVGRIPRGSRAAAALEQVMGQTRDVPINTRPAEEAVQRAQELQQRGSTLPKVLRDFIRNRTAATGDFMGQPATEAMTYEVGRDFASNAGGLSSREATALNAKMHRQVSEFAAAMRNANREAAAKVGMGDLYDAAMREYRQAKTLEDAGEILKKYGIKAALAAAGGGIAGKVALDMWRSH